MTRRQVLGISVGRGMVRAVFAGRDRLEWAGSTPWSDEAELGEAIAALAGEASQPVRRARVVLERELVQTRTVTPIPPLRRSAVARYVALQAPRLFRKNGFSLVTDGTIVQTANASHALWAAAAAESLVQGIVQGCEQAGIAVDAIGPAADVLPHATSDAAGELVFPNGGTAEVVSVAHGGTWRSRLVAKTEHTPAQLVGALECLGSEAMHFAGAYGASIAPPRLSLIPENTRATRLLEARRRLIRVGVIAAALWLAAAGTYTTRLARVSRSAQRELERNRPALDSALALGRQLEAGGQSLDEFAHLTAARSRKLALIAALTSALEDSAYLVSLRIDQTGMLRLTGYAPSAGRVLSVLQRLSLIHDVRLEGPAIRERIPGGGDLDRFAILAPEDTS